MTEIADDRSWWADVEHLRPGGEGTRSATATPGSARATAIADRAPVDPAGAAPSYDEGPITASRQTRTVRGERESPRLGRITGLPIEPARTRARRPDVAAFADALDLDGAFGTSPPASRSREIILTGSSISGDGTDRTVARPDEDDPHAHLQPAEDAVAGSTSTGQHAAVQRSDGHGLQAQVAERRALRELGDRRPRSTVQRAVHHPDRIAMYVVLLGLFLVFVAAFTSSAGS